jgi:Dolichyl-phosphate-mannose-protein mannosyltransferase
VTARNFIARHKVGLLTLIILLGLALRLQGLGQVGFNEDEIMKVEAAQSYLRGDFSVNLEHPMLMKSMVVVSMASCHWWNRHAGREHPIPDEIAVRLPNVIFGSLTSIVLFLIAQEFFGNEVGLLAALLWSIGTIAIMDNRIAKEDTLLVFFTWLAYYFYVRAKHTSATQPRLGEKFYAASGASFGLMLASKYFPHYLGLIFLYYYLLGDKQKYPPRRRRDSILLFGSAALVFLLADPVMLLPSTWRYMLHYVRGGAVVHHGYLMMGQLRYEDLAHFAHGMPVYFYLLFLAIKTPLPILGAFAVGLIEVIGRRRQAGASFILFMFLLWIVPFSLLSVKWLRWMLSWMPAVYIIAAVGLTSVLAWLRSLFQSRLPQPLEAVAVAILAAVFLVQPLWVAAKSAPFYTLYLNPLGWRPAGYYFPHDELNDTGLLPAIREICAEAPQGATVAGESKPVFAYYLHRFGRDDLHYVEITNDIQITGENDPYFVAQRGRLHLENSIVMHELESQARPEWTVNLRGVSAAQVYHLDRLGQLRASR